MSATSLGLGRSPGFPHSAGELVDQYGDLSLGLVDATVIAATEMPRETKVATLDHRRFEVVRPARAPSLTLLP